MTANGKIDVYSKDSISMHTENDFNLTADRDINLNAGRNFNVLSKEDIQVETNANMTTYVAMNNQVTTLLDYDVNTTGANKFTAGGTTDINSGGNHTETAPQIHMNGPQAATATAVTPLYTHVLPGATATATTGRRRRLFMEAGEANSEGRKPSQLAGANGVARASYCAVSLDRWSIVN